MTVSELIEKLKEFDPDLIVVVDGYECFGAYDVVKNAEKTQATKNPASALSPEAISHPFYVSEPSLFDVIKIVTSDN